MNDQFKPQGIFTVKQFRDGKLIDQWDAPNLITTEGKNHALNVVFNSGTQITAWKVGLIGRSGFSAIAASNTAAQIGGSNGWSEFTSYSGGTRPAWVPAAASAGSMDTNTDASFSISGSGTVKGLFIVSGTGSVLWCATLFAGGDKLVANGETLEVSYTVSA